MIRKPRHSIWLVTFDIRHWRVAVNEFVKYVDTDSLELEKRNLQIIKPFQIP